MSKVMVKSEGQSGDNNICSTIWGTVNSGHWWATLVPDWACSNAFLRVTSEFSASNRAEYKWYPVWARRNAFLRVTNEFSASNRAGYTLSRMRPPSSRSDRCRKYNVLLDYVAIISSPTPRTDTLLQFGVSSQKPVVQPFRFHEVTQMQCARTSDTHMQLDNFRFLRSDT